MISKIFSFSDDTHGCRCPRWLSSGRGPVAVLLAVTAAALFPSLFNGFVNWDDPAYIMNNPVVAGPLPGALREIWTGFVVGNYHPLATLSLRLQYALHGPAPFPFHLLNLFLHLANVALVWGLLRALSFSTTVAFGAALLFGIHPMHVEAVAWASARKDVLFGFFYLWGLRRYVLAGDRPSGRDLLAVGAGFVLSLLAKPSAISFPLAMIVVDLYRGRSLGPGYWPARIPFFLLSAVFGAIAVAASASPFSGYDPYMYDFSWLERLGLSGLALMLYTVLLVLPVRLSVFYPYPGVEGYPADTALWSAAALCGIAVLGALFLALRSGAPRILRFGVLFFVTTIMFNLPFTAMGHVLLGDRFTYLPGIGIFVLMMAVLERLLSRPGRTPAAVTGIRTGVAVYAVCLAAAAFGRTLIWKNSGTLWSDAIAKYPSSMAYHNRADYYVQTGDVDRAAADYAAALRHKPDHVSARNNLANMSVLRGDCATAVAQYTMAIEQAPEFLPAYANRAACRAAMGDTAAALTDYDTILSLDPDNAPARTEREKLLHSGK